ncbi:gliding motility-associated C-terminal domain-containing protein [Spirosoma spitsbergense]|uniref:gliding motility-associated C-terminal domain-containing protein n=1 Tax=Spirosoma spitsbergense TaxID=431554 RepID=UPI000475C6F3|nr:gliding motility-associated C-terminal domain-containing protein [Spirosoma spitsbergense]
MRKQLQGKFIGLFGWVMAVWFMTFTNVVAGFYPVSDTCQHPEPPIITGSAGSICRNERVTLTASGCTGTVVWSNGDTGNVITVSPQQTTKYTAICRAQQGCISCFAEVWKVTVNTPAAPLVTPSSRLVCPDENVTLTASNCAGTLHWLNPTGNDKINGPIWQGKLRQTTTFQATCEQNSCISNPSVAASIQVAVPATPDIAADKGEICAGHTVQLTASGCVGSVLWTDGGKGAIRTVRPDQTTTYRAVCQIGSCQSDQSEQITVSVRKAESQPDLLTTITNGCPFQTADLSKAIPESSGPRYYAFRTEPSLNSTVVESPGAVLAGTYYVFGRNRDGCYTQPAPINVTITPCPNAIPPCLSNPATIAIRLDSFDWSKGDVELTAQLNGFGGQPAWQSDGGGVFTNSGLQAHYQLSEADRQRRTITFTLSVPDPDGSGPCTAASAQQIIMAPSPEIVGLSMNIAEPTWVVEGTNHFVDLTYQLTAVNMGTHQLTNIKIGDDLTAVFLGVGALIKTVTIRSDNSLKINGTYTGRGTDTTLIDGGNLPVGGQAQAWITVRLDVSQASTLTFSNKAIVRAMDITGRICQDHSTSGTNADPDQNGNPADNDEPTSITLQSLRTEEKETVFIPEGFSPNGDGINDLFVIQYVPGGIRVQIGIYNRWGTLVYQNEDYKNEWDGTANQGIRTSGTGQNLPDGTYYYQVRLSDGREFVRFLTLAR